MATSITRESRQTRNLVTTLNMRHGILLCQKILLFPLEDPLGQYLAGARYYVTELELIDGVVGAGCSRPEADRLGGDVGHVSGM